MGESDDVSEADIDCDGVNVAVKVEEEDSDNERVWLTLAVVDCEDDTLWVSDEEVVTDVDCEEVNECV